MKSHFYTLGDDQLVVIKHDKPLLSYSPFNRYAWTIRGRNLNCISSQWIPRGQRTFPTFTQALLAGIHFLNYLRAYNPNADPNRKLVPENK